MQRYSDRPEKWAGRNLMKFKKGKCRVLCLGNNLRHQCSLVTKRLESSSAEMALMILMDTKLNMS